MLETRFNALAPTNLGTIEKFEMHCHQSNNCIYHSVVLLQQSNLQNQSFKRRLFTSYPSIGYNRIRTEELDKELVTSSFLRVKEMSVRRTSFTYVDESLAFACI